MRLVRAFACAAAALVCSQAARADGADFGYVYTADIEEPGETELSLWATHRGGKDEGRYSANDYRLEIERGLTDRLQVSAYVNFAGHHVRGIDGEFERVDRALGFQGLSAEFKYQLRSPDKGRLGIAVYAEPGWSRISKVTGEIAPEYELELKAIVQKNFAADRLTWAANLTLEPEWERERERSAGTVTSRTEEELGLELSTGLSYRMAPGLWFGAEARYHSVYPDWTHGLNRENYAVYAGPTIHYAAREWSLTATFLPQLFGGPGKNGSSLELDDHEKTEFRVKISREF